jgi:hypothetical protein
VNGVERRYGDRRCPAADDPLAVIRLRTGRQLRVINIGPGGALVEGLRLLPGASLDMHLPLGDGRLLVRGRVIRSEVSRLDANGIAYRSGLAFDRPVDLSGYSVPTLSSDVGGQQGSRYPSAGLEGVVRR